MASVGILKAFLSGAAKSATTTADTTRAFGAIETTRLIKGLECDGTDGIGGGIGRVSGFFAAGPVGGIGRVSFRTDGTEDTEPRLTTSETTGAIEHMS